MREMSLYNQKYVADTFAIEVLFPLLEQLMKTKKIPKTMQYNPRIRREVQAQKASLYALLCINLKAIYEKYYYHC
jgi:hypothetical protein